MAGFVEQVNKNGMLFIAMRENRPFIEKLAKVKKCLDEGADVNAADSNDGGNTPLHMAMRSGEEMLVTLLLNKGAAVSAKNFTGQTPTDIARNLELKKKIMNLDADRRHNEYSLTFSGTSGVTKQKLYETKLLSLLLLRALNDKEIEYFRLNNTTSDSDDVCLWYQVKGKDKPVALFIRTRDRNKEIKNTAEENYTNYFLKLFKSYLKIKDQSNSKNSDLFDRNFCDVDCNFIIFMQGLNKSAFTENIENNLSSKIHYLINAGEKMEILQYYSNEEHLQKITKMIIMEELKALGITISKIIISRKSSQMAMADKLVARYNVVLGQIVLQQCNEQPEIENYRTWEFRREFFRSDCEYLATLKKSLIKSFSIESKMYRERSDNNKFNENNENVIYKAIETKLISIKIKLPLSFGNIDMHFRGNDMKVIKRVKFLAHKIIHIINVNEKSQIIYIDEELVGPGKMVEKAVMEINGGIGSAIGNLLIFDPDTKLLKINCDNQRLSRNAALVLKELKYATDFEVISNCRFKINIDGLPKASLEDDEYDKDKVKDFIKRVWFYNYQPHENYSLSGTIDYESEKYCFKKGNEVFLRLHDEIQKYWISKQQNKFLDSEILKREVLVNLYKTKLLTLIYIRRQKDEQIATLKFENDIHGIADMDVICLRYRVKGRKRPVALFMLVKVENDPGADIFDCRGIIKTSGKLKLQEILESYLKSKGQFQTDNIFEEDFYDFDPNFVLYTSANGTFKKKNTEHQVSEKLHYLINTGQNEPQYKYDYNEDDVIFFTKIIIIEQLKKLAKVFIETIISEKSALNILKIEPIARYHVVLGREVLQQIQSQQKNEEYCVWKFQPEFFEKDCEFLVSLQKALVKELSTNQIDKSLITDEDCDSFKAFLQDPCADILGQVIGKLIKFNKFTKKLELIDVTALSQKFEAEDFSVLLKQFKMIKIAETVINKSIEIKLTSMQIKLPLSFGNIDMNFSGDANFIQRKMDVLSNKLMELLKLNEKTMILDMNDDIVGNGKIIERDFIEIQNCLGGAVGNLLILDPDTQMLKFDLDNQALPENATLFLDKLKEYQRLCGIKELSKYRIRINMSGFPKISLDYDEHDKSEARFFLDNLWFYSNQAKEEELTEIIRNEMSSLLI